MAHYNIRFDLKDPNVSKHIDDECIAWLGEEKYAEIISSIAAEIIAKGLTIKLYKYLHFIIPMCGISGTPVKYMIRRAWIIVQKHRAQSIENMPARA